MPGSVRRFRRKCGIEVVQDQIADCKTGLFGVCRILQRLQRAVDGHHVALGVDLADECLDRRRLARLARRVDDEVLPSADEPPDFGETVERGEHVVLPRNAWSRDVEIAFHDAEYTKAAHSRQALMRVAQRAAVSAAVALTKTLGTAVERRHYQKTAYFDKVLTRRKPYLLLICDGV